ncbi:MAG: sulfatase-like hydrolase/transferase, partial [Phycisphaerales bacterium]
MIRFLALAIVFLQTSTAIAQDSKPPNIILFVSDDHRADVLGCAGHPIVQTPNIDRLAADGVRFENAFVTTSICAASRASILTGLPERSHQFTFGRPPLNANLIASTYPAVLRKSGYRTAFIGKLGVSIGGGRASIDAMFDEFTPLSLIHF